MEQYVSKSALVTEIEKIRAKWFGINNDFAIGQKVALTNVLSLINTFEVKEVGISITSIDDILEAGEGLDPDSKEAKIFKECYYMALEKLKEKSVMV